MLFSRHLCKEMTSGPGQQLVMVGDGEGTNRGGGLGLHLGDVFPMKPGAGANSRGS